MTTLNQSQVVSLSYAPVHLLSESEKSLAQTTRKALRKKGHSYACKSDHEILAYLDGVADHFFGGVSCLRK